MYLSFAVTIVIAFVLSILILKLLSKTFKVLVFLVIFVVTFGILYFGYDTFTSKFKQLDNVAPTTNTPSLPASSCSADSDCAFVISPSDCNLLANSCNNLRDSSKFFRSNTKSKCSIDAIVLSSDIKCACIKVPEGSKCGKL